MRDKKYEEMLKRMINNINTIDKKDPKRIDRILKLINGIWKKGPDLRLCQLIGNCFEAGDSYYKEDEELEQKLKEIYKDV